ncbi:MAG: hypothetical protein WBE43_08330, partial [Candidatus Acidiferrales bacterium]
MRRVVAVLAFLAFGFLPGAAFAQRSTQEYIRAGKLLDVHSGRILENMIIIINGDRIDRVAKADEITIPDGATVIDLSHAYVLPGLID